MRRAAQAWSLFAVLLAEGSGSRTLRAGQITKCEIPVGAGASILSVRLLAARCADRPFRSECPQKVQGLHFACLSCRDSGPDHRLTRPYRIFGPKHRLAEQVAAPPSRGRALAPSVLSHGLHECKSDDRGPRMEAASGVRRQPSRPPERKLQRPVRRNEHRSPRVPTLNFSRFHGGGARRRADAPSQESSPRRLSPLRGAKVETETTSPNERP